MMIKVLISDLTDHIEIPKDVAEKMIVVKNIISSESFNPEDVIPLPNVVDRHFKLALEYLVYHNENPIYIIEARPESYRTDNIIDWDLQFTEKMDQPLLFQMIETANYLDIKTLLDLLLKTVAKMMKGKTPQQIRDTFGLENDLTPEEEEEIRKENEWIDDK